MALTATEEAQLRLLLAQQAALLSLAGNESTITSKLGGAKVTLSDLAAAVAAGDPDLLLIRQGGADKSVTFATLKAGISPTDSTTQAYGDATTKIATTAFVDRLRDVPRDAAKGGAYTLALTDRGRSISTAFNVTIPANAAVAFPIGTVITVINTNSAAIAISITTDTLRQAGTANSGARTLAGYGLATLFKADTNLWFAAGAGVS